MNEKIVSSEKIQIKIGQIANSITAIEREILSKPKLKKQLQDNPYCFNKMKINFFNAKENLQNAIVNLQKCEGRRELNKKEEEQELF